MRLRILVAVAAVVLLAASIPTIFASDTVPLTPRPHRVFDLSTALSEDLVAFWSEEPRFPSVTVVAEPSPSLDLTAWEATRSSYDPPDAPPPPPPPPAKKRTQRAASAPSIAVNKAPPEGAEAWRSLVSIYFLPDRVDQALRILFCESRGDPNATNSRSGAAGLFQHMPRYWADRSAKAGWGGWDIYNPEANVAVAAWLSNQGTDWRHWVCRP